MSLRTRELGTRTAFGARSEVVMSMVLRQCLVVSLVGIAIGLALALALSQIMAGLLFDVTPLDPLTFSLVPPMLLAVALLASVVPARRAARVDPTVAFAGGMINCRGSLTRTRIYAARRRWGNGSASV